MSWFEISRRQAIFCPIRIPNCWPVEGASKFMSWFEIPRRQAILCPIRKANLCPDLKLPGVKQIYVLIWNSTASSSFLSSWLNSRPRWEASKFMSWFQISLVSSSFFVQFESKFYVLVERQANLCPDLKFRCVKQFFVQFGKQIYVLVERQANLCLDLKFHCVKQFFV